MNKHWQEINWTDNNDKITDHFRVHEALWLPSWRIYHIPSDEEKQQIVSLASFMEKIRELQNRPIFVHCWIRPLKVNRPGTQFHKKNYNKYVGSTSRRSPHIFGRAVDFHVAGFAGPKKCAEIRNMILPNLQRWNIRMENIEGGWIHIDNYPVRNRRFFRP